MEKEKLLVINSENKEERFSVIEVYPFLHYSNSDDINQGELNNIFQLSLDPEKCSFNIRVRSKEAQEEVYSFLVGHGLDDVICLDGNVVGMNQTQKIIDDLEPDEVLEQPRYRYYYTENSSTQDILLSRSSLSIRVSFKTEDLCKFKKILYKLRDSLGYKNKWLGEESLYEIK